MKLIRDLSDVQEVLSVQAKNRQVIWLGKRGYDAVGLGQLFGQDVGIFSWDYSPEIGCPLYSAELETGVRKKGDTVELVPKLWDLELPDGAIVIPYQSAVELEELAKAKTWKLLSNPMSVKQVFKDKLNFSKILKQAGVPYLKHEEMPLNQLDFGLLATTYGLPYVVQFPTGSSGRGTFLVQTAENIWEVKEQGKIQNINFVRVAEFIQGNSPSVNVITTCNGIIVAPPSHQLLGLSQVSPGFGKYCGNDFGVETTWKPALHTNSQYIGQYLWTIGYKGIFGIDYADVVPVEINDRFNGGTGTLTQICLNNGVIPPIAFHLLEMLGVEYRFDVKLYNEQLWSMQLQGFHILLKNQTGKQLRVLNQVQSGVYTLPEKNLQRNGVTLADLDNTDEFLVTGGVPKSGTCLDPGTTICKISGLSAIYDPELKDLTCYGNQIVKATLDLFETI